MKSIAKVVETYNDGNYVTILLFNETTKNGFYYEFETSNLVTKWSEILKDLNELDNSSYPKSATAISRAFNNEDELIGYFEDNIL